MASFFCLLWLLTCSFVNVISSDFRFVPYEDVLETANRFSEPGVTFYSEFFFDVPRKQLIVGASVIEQLGGKQLVMQLLGHDDPNVRYEALIAVQKLMVHNWEYLGRQLEKEQTQPATSAPGGMPAAKA